MTRNRIPSDDVLDDASSAAVSGDDGSHVSRTRPAVDDDAAAEFRADLGEISPIGPHRTVESILVRELRSLIIEGKLRAGASLPYRELARQFNVSVTPVRIALRDLAKEGLVEIKPHGGVRVVSLSIEELEEVYAMRVGLESWLARRGAPNLSDLEFDRMETYFRDIEQSAHDLDRQAFLHSAWAHRSTCYRAAERPRLLDEVTLLFRRTARYNQLALFPQEQFNHSLAFAQDFREACSERDGVRAQHVIRGLLDKSLEHLTANLPDLLNLQ